MIFVKTTEVGAFAQAAADRQLEFTVMPSVVPGRTRITGPHDNALLELALNLGVFPDTGARWPGDTQSE